MKTPTGTWPDLKRFAGDVFRSSLHFSIASLNQDGTPHVSPIGSLLFLEPGKAIYFEILTQQLPMNLDAGSPVTILGVDSRRRLWLRALATGRFSTPPAIRMSGTAGPKREATPEEIRRFKRKLGPLKILKGYGMLWGGLRYVREINLTQIHPVNIGGTTRHFEWPSDVLE